MKTTANLTSLHNLQIKVTSRPDSRHIEVWLGDDTPDGVINYTLEDGYLKGEEHKTEEILSDRNKLKPFLSLPVLFANKLFRAMAEYLANTSIKTKDENLIEGKLQATEKHLEDMREFAKKFLDAYTNNDHKKQAEVH